LFLSIIHLDFCISNDERIRSYLTYQDWNDELQDANENRWTVDQNKFDQNYIVREYEIQRKKTYSYSFLFSRTSEGPFIRVTSPNGDETFKDLVGISFSFSFYLIFLQRFGIGLIHLTLK
jgi:hypothetical protein